MYGNNSLPQQIVTKRDRVRLSIINASPEQAYTFYQTKENAHDKTGKLDKTLSITTGKFAVA